MSNNLLITMGCSYTEGVGCYGHADPEFMERMKKLLVSNLNYSGQLWQQSEWREFMETPETKKRQQDYGWPRQLAGPLNRNLVNLGRGGDSNSAQVKLLYESDTYTGQDVLVVFLVTGAERFSFYRKNSPRSYMPLMVADISSGPEERLFVEHYVRSQDLEQGSQREAEFYIRAAEALCQARGWQFVWLPAFSHYDYQGSNRLHPDILAYEWLIKPRDFALCSHPNEQGYKIIAENLLALIKEFYIRAKNF